MAQSDNPSQRLEICCCEKCSQVQKSVKAPHFFYLQGNVTIGPSVENFLCELVPLQIARGRQPFQLTTELTDMEDGTYELKYGLPVEGQYELSIRLFGHHISGSPFKVGNLKKN